MKEHILSAFWSKIYKAIFVIYCKCNMQYSCLLAVISSETNICLCPKMSCILHRLEFVSLHFSLTISVFYCHAMVHIYPHTYIQNARQFANFHISWSWILLCIFQILYSRVSGYKSWSISFSQLSSPPTASTQLCTQWQAIFNNVKGHSIWQHSIAYSCEMDYDCNKIDNLQSATPKKSNEPLTFYVSDGLWTDRKERKK